MSSHHSHSAHAMVSRISHPRFQFILLCLFVVSFFTCIPQQDQGTHLEEIPTESEVVLKDILASPHRIESNDQKQSILSLESTGRTQAKRNIYSAKSVAAHKQYIFTNYTQEHGLPSGTIRGIHKDTTGYIWITSEQGLSRFDGYQFKVFKHHPDDNTSVPLNGSWAAALTKYGDNYFGNRNMYSLYDAATETFSHDFPFGDSIKVFLIDESPCCANEYWVASRFSLFRVSKTGTERFPLPKPIEINTTSEKEWKFVFSTDDRVLIFNNTPSKSGFFLFDSKTKKIHVLSVPDQQRMAPKLIADIVYTGHQFYLFTNNSIYQLDAATNSFTWQADYRPSQLFDYASKGFVAINDTLVLVRTKSAHIKIINLRSNDVKSIYLNTKLPEAQLNDRAITFCRTVKDGVWLGTNQMGIIHYNIFTNEVAQYIHDPQNSNSLPGNLISYIYPDDNGIIWAASPGYGLIKMEPVTPLFKTGVPTSMNDLSSDAGYSKNVRGFIETDDGYWIATSNGLFQYSNKTKQYTDIQKQFPTNYVKENEALYESNYPFNALAKDKQGNIWIGTGFGELFIFNPALNRSFKVPLSQRFGLGIFSLFCDHKNRMWIGAHSQGVYRIDASTLDINKISEIKIEPIVLNSKDLSSASLGIPYFFTEDAEGTIWIGTEIGLYRYKDQDKQWERFSHIPGEENSLHHNSVRSICVDLQGTLWIGTNGGGLNRYNKSENNFSHFTSEKGLTNDQVYSMVCDDHGMLWLGTQNGLSKFNPSDYSFRNFTAKDGIQNFEFNTGAAKKLKDGTLLIGGITGYNIIDPDKIENNLLAPPSVVLTSIKIFDKSIPIGNSPLKLNYQENSLSFEFATLTYYQNRDNKYAYRLEGVDRDWVYGDTRRYVSYSQLKPGHYTFKVKGSNWDGIWNETGTQFRFTISPPWWRTWLAYGGYLVITAGIFYFLLSIYKRRVLLQQLLQTEQKEAIRLKELDTFKSQLFTNLTHEFRTPLTVILGMSKQMANGTWRSVVGEKENSRLTQSLSMIENNGKNLLQLINQLLDLSKLENNSFKLQNIQSDIVSYLRYLTDSFQSYAEDIGIALRFSTDIDSLVMDFDPEQMKQIMTNLISNALKFTVNGGEVSVDVSNMSNQLEIKVKDTGIGISEKDLPHVLDRFYQVDNSTTRLAQGTGVGLAHTQELLKIMGGRIALESELGKGTSVTVHLPIHHEAPIIEKEELSLPSKPHLGIARPQAESVTDDPSMLAQEASGYETQPQLLIIEDNPDVVEYLKSCLELQYRISVAYNGKAGVEKALEEIPDFIISDVMMPEMDGYQVCDKLKNDERTSHIPIILLTAKADAASRMVGLRRGADAYMAKPFSPEELHIHISMLLDNRRRMAAHYSKLLHNGTSHPSEVSVVPEAIQFEDAFMKKVNTIIEAHYKDENFSLPELSKEIGMSRSQLLRKLKAIADTNPSDLIRTYRLKKAKALLESGDVTVSEATYQTGFRDPSYFSKLFQEEFGILPRAVKNNE